MSYTKLDDIELLQNNPADPDIDPMYDDVEEYFSPTQYLANLVEAKDVLVSPALLEASEQFLLENAKKNLAFAKSLQTRLGADTHLDKDVLDKINRNLTGRGKHKKTKKKCGGKLSKGKRKKKKSKTKSKTKSKDNE